MTADTSSIPGYYLQFASDNAAGVCPEALAAMNEANSGFAASYGNDDATKLVCDRLRERCGRRPSVDRAAPDLRINVHASGETADVALDLSGEALHRRGYREATVTAPLP